MAVDTHDKPESVGDLPARVVADILADEHRRVLLSCLARRGEMPVNDLAAEVLSREGETVNEEDRRRMRREIYQAHLPKLTATGVVTYDSLRGTVALARPELVRQADL
jgi:hypothetical protein